MTFDSLRPGGGGGGSHRTPAPIHISYIVGPINLDLGTDVQHIEFYRPHDIITVYKGHQVGALLSETEKKKYNIMLHHSICGQNSDILNENAPYLCVA